MPKFTNKVLERLHQRRYVPMTMENYKYRDWSGLPEYMPKGQLELHREEVKDRYASLERLISSTLDKADRDGRDLTQYEAQTLTTMEEELTVLNSVPAVREQPPEELLRRMRQANGLKFKDVRSGQMLSAYRHDEPIHLGPPLNVGNFLYCMMTGRLDELGDQEALAASGSSQTSGGYLLTPSMSSTVIDLARAASVCFRAGAQTVPMDTSELVLARIATDPTVYWRGETVAVTASEPAFQRVTLQAKTLACLVPVSIELLEDSANAGDVITAAIQTALAAELDAAIIDGAGAAAEPLGIVNTTGVNAIGTVGTPTDWSNPSAAVGDILAANYPGGVETLSWLSHPAVQEIYDGLVEGTTGAPLQPTPWVAKLRKFYTTKMPLASANYTDIVGDFSQVLVGMRTSGMVVNILDSGTATDASSDTWNAATQLMKFIRVYLRADVALLQPSWFTVSTGITLT